MFIWRSDELKHHGVKGMKWGVRKDYKKKGRLTKGKKQEYNKLKKQELTDKQKRYIKVGATVAVTALAMYGAYKLDKSGKLSALISKGRKHLEVNGLELDDNLVGYKKLTRKESFSDTISKINPTKERNNCYNCVTASILRLCGIDVSAKPARQGKVTFDDVARVFNIKDDDIGTSYNPTFDGITRILNKKYVDGDIGVIGVAWNNDYKRRRGIESSERAGHVLNWIKENGEIKFFDSQANQHGQFLHDFIKNNIDNTPASFAKFANMNDRETIMNKVDKDLLKDFVK